VNGFFSKLKLRIPTLAVLYVLALIGFRTLPTTAQVANGTLSGSVVDQSEAVVADATVTSVDTKGPSRGSASGPRSSDGAPKPHIVASGSTTSSAPLEAACSTERAACSRLASLSCVAKS